MDNKDEQWFSQTEDAQHRHAAVPVYTNIQVGPEAFQLMYDHILGLNCESGVKFDMDTPIPFEFVVEKDSTAADVICGFCKKRLGSASLIQCRDKK